MSGLDGFRQEHPEYADVPDLELADALHEKFYSDVPKDEYLKALNLGEKSSAVGTFARSAGREALPTAAAMVGAGLGAAGTGALLGAEAGAVTGPVAPIAVPVLTVLGALAGGFGAAYLTSEAQDKLLGMLPEGLQKAIGQDAETRKKDGEEHPIASAAGSFFPQLAAMRPGAVVEAAKGASALEKLFTSPVGSRVVGGGLGAGIEAASEASGDGDWDPARLVGATATGALLNRPTKLGSALERLGARPITGKAALDRTPDPEVPPEVKPLLLSPPDKMGPSVDFADRLYTVPERLGGGPGGKMPGIQVDELLHNNNHIPEVADVLTATGLGTDVQWKRGLSALSRVPETDVNLAARDSEVPPTQDEKTPLEAGTSDEGPLPNQGMTGEEARTYAGLVRGMRQKKLNDNKELPKPYTDFTEVPPQPRLGPPAEPKRLTGPAEAMEFDNSTDEATGNFLDTTDSINNPKGLETSKGEDLPTKTSPDVPAKSEWSGWENGKPVGITEEQGKNIKALVKHLAGDSVMSVQFRTPEEIGKLFKESGGDNSHPAFGIYSDLGRPRTGMIAVATNGGYADTANLAAHEAYHAADKWLSNARERTAVSQDFSRLEKGVRETMKDAPFDQMDQKTLRREIPAYAFQMYSRVRMSGGKYKMPTWLRPPVRRTFEPLYQFFDKLRHIITGKTSQTAEHFFESMLKGEVGLRKSGIETPRNYEKPLLSQAVATAEEKGPPRVKDMSRLSSIFNSTMAKADKIPGYRPVANLVFARRELSQQIINNILRPVGEAFRSVKAPQHRLLSRGLEAAEGHGRVFEPNSAGEIIIPTVEKDHLGRDTNTTLSKPGEVTRIPKELVKPFQEAQKANYMMREALIESELDFMGLDPKSSLKDLQASEDPVAHNLAAWIENLRQQPNWMPHVRAGDVGMTVHKKTDDNGKPLPREKWGSPKQFVTFDLIGPQGSFRRNAAESFSRNHGVMKKTLADLRQRYPEKDYHVSEPFNMTYDQMKASLGTKVGALHVAADMFSSLDPTTKKKLLEDIKKELSIKGFKAHFTHRENIPGWVTHDNAHNYTTRAISNYVTKGAHFIAGNKYDQKLEEAKDALGKNNQPVAMKDAQSLIDYLQSGAEEFQTLRNLDYLWYLGYNFAPALVNMTQTLHTTVPVLSGLAGLKATPAVGSAMGQATKIMAQKGIWKSIIQGDPHAILNAKQPAGMSTATWKALQQEIREGGIFPAQGMENAGLSGEHEVITGVRKQLHDVAQKMSAWFGTAESFNRMTAFIAAHELASKDPTLLVKSKDILSHESENPEDFARNVVRRTQFIMDKTNRASFQRNLGAVPTQFMSYQLGMFELAAHLLRRSGPEGKKALALMAMGMVATSGVWSVTGMDNLRQGIEFAYKQATDEDLDIDSKLREAMSELGGNPDIVSRGLVPYLTGASLAGRAGAGQIVNPQMFSGDVSSMMGPAGGLLIGNMHDAMENSKNGRPWAAVASVMPTFVKNIDKALNATQEGFRSKTLRETYVPQKDVTKGQLVNQLLGFTPEEVGREQAFQYADKRLKGATVPLTQRYNLEAANHLIEQQNANAKGDTKKAREAGENFDRLLDKVNKENLARDPADMIRLSRSSIRDALLENTDPDIAAIKKLPKNKRDRGQELRSIYNVQ